MKSILLFSLVLVVGLASFLWIAQTSIQLNPFKITVQKPWTAMGFFLVLTGIGLISYESRKIAKHEGVIEGMNAMADAIKTEIREGRLP